MVEQTKNPAQLLLEIAVFTLPSALMAASAGADRLELCDNPIEGGTTPSFGFLKIVREKISIPVFPIIRPRGGDFLYSDDEYEAMQRDISLCKALGFEGVVTGGLLKDGSIASEQLKRLVAAAYPMEVTFHRAFDRASHPLEALEQVIACGCTRILTSGQLPEAYNGKELIRQLVDQSGERIIIMPGSGVRSKQIAELAQFTGAKEFHSSARKTKPSLMVYQNEGMQENLDDLIVNKEEINKMKVALQSLIHS